MRVQVFLGIGILILEAAGCGSSNIQHTSQGLAAPTPAVYQMPVLPVTQEALIGNWIAHCQADPTRRGVFVQEYLQVDLQETNQLTLTYLDAACTQLLYQQNVRSEYLFSARGSLSETRKEVDVTPYSSIAINLFTRYQGFCGTRIWAVNEEQKFRDVEKCDVPRVMNSNISLRGDQSASQLTKNECPRIPGECYSTVFEWNKGR